MSSDEKQGARDPRSAAMPKTPALIEATLLHVPLTRKQEPVPP
eukprot:CAMPEP_0180283270 /NCGR_PEP_ID=MMETSP0988-20121125/10370_1 /TAXON_ID=697907 /ORGANISM="non described non described, Strain CCMP2293" /LENGTH=42 /DNA_ID= /DNA_START= /DNA_END= /DNA_ORIENTATION=